MLGTSTTPYDLRFRFLDIPVRIHPLFWLMAAVLGFQENNIPAVLIWIGCILVSILVHEYGHGLMAKHFHGSPSIVLYGLGGLCSSQGERTPGQRLAVLFAGPGAGFILCAVVLAVASLALGITGGEHLAVMQRLVGLRRTESNSSARCKGFRRLTFSWFITTWSGSTCSGDWSICCRSIPWTGVKQPRLCFPRLTADTGSAVLILSLWSLQACSPCCRPVSAVKITSS